MARRTAITGIDKAAGIKENLRIQFDGDAVLSSKNQADNPTLERFDANGDLEEWELDSPPEETGFTPFIKGPGFPKYTAQSDSIPFDKPFWEQKDPLVDGDPPEDRTHRAAVAPFSLPPEIRIIEADEIGFAEGWRGITHAYGVGHPNGKHLLTNCAPLEAIYLDQGDGITITVSETPPEGVDFVVIGITEAKGTEAAALNELQVFQQRVEKVKPRLQPIITLKGPFSKKERLYFGQNETFLGHPVEDRRTKKKNKKKPGRSKNSRAASSTQVGFALKTQFGMTDTMGLTSADISQDEEIEWEPDYVEGAQEWEPRFIANTGNVQKLRQRKIGEKASISSNDPEEIREAGESVAPVAETDLAAEEDESGIEGPDGPVGDFEAADVGGSILSPGTYRVRLAKDTVDPDDGREEQSALGPAAAVVVGAGQYFRVYPPKDYRNWIENAEGRERDNDAASSPLGWETPTVTGVTDPDDEPGKRKHVDASGSPSDEEVRRTKYRDVSSKPTVVHRTTVEVKNYTSGRVRYVMQQKRANATTSRTTLGSWDEEGEYDVRVRLAEDAGDNVDEVWDANVAEVQFILEHVGSSGAGARNLTSTWYNPIMVFGKKYPRKRGKDSPVSGGPGKKRRRVSLSFERPEDPYPTFGYTTVVIDPKDSERAVLGAGYVPGNFIEYYGPEGTPVTSTYFAGGFKMPVKPGEQRTVSVHFYWEGVEQAATPLKMLLKDRRGRLITDYGAFEGTSGVTEDSDDEVDADANGWVRRKLTVTAPADSEAAYLELVSGGCGDGLFRIMGIQNELGATMTAFDITHAPSGSLISTFDLGIPGVPRGELSTLPRMSRFVAFGAEVTHDESGDTSHTVEIAVREYDGVWSDWVDDLADLPEGEWDEARIRTTLETDDLDVTPQLHSHFIDFERKNDFAPEAFGSLLRSDGTEFPGTVTLYDFPPIRTQHPVIQEEFADGSRGFANMGKATKWARGFGAECYLQSTAEEITELIGEQREDQTEDEASVLVAEIRGRRHALRIVEMEFPPPENSEAHDPIQGMEEDGRWNLRAEGIEGEVLGSEAF